MGEEKVNEYLTKQSEQVRKELLRIREIVKLVVPEAVEKLSYGVPSFKFGKMTFMYAGFKEHIGIYPSPEVIEHFQERLVNYSLSKGTIRVPLNEPINEILVKDMVLFMIDKEKN